MAGRLSQGRAARQPGPRSSPRGVLPIALEIKTAGVDGAALNAAHPSVAYRRSLGAVISDVDAALAGSDRDAMLPLAAALDADNNLGCPLS